MRFELQVTSEIGQETLIGAGKIVNFIHKKVIGVVVVSYESFEQCIVL